LLACKSHTQIRPVETAQSSSYKFYIKPVPENQNLKIIVCSNINSLASARIRGFSEKKRLNAHGFAGEFLLSGMLYRPGKSLWQRCGKSSSLHSKKNFLLGGCGFFVSDVISGGLLGNLGPLCLALGANR